MSRRELTRVEVMARVKAGTLSLGTAAGMLGVSYRQAKRLWRRYRQAGAKGLQHRAVGKPSNRGTAARVRQRALGLIRAEVQRRGGRAVWADAGGRALGERGWPDRFITKRCVGGCWRRGCGVARGSGSPYRQRRERRAHAGELVQLDGSFHAWFEQRAPTQPCLITLVDDATSQSFGTIQRRRKRSGPPWSVAAVDRNVRRFRRRCIPTGKTSMCAWPTSWSGPQGLVPRTQFGRMCEALGIRDYRGEFAASEGPDRTEPRHASGSAGEEAAAAGQGRSDEAANAFLDPDVLAGAQRAFHAAGGGARRRAPPLPDAAPARSDLSPRRNAHGGRRLDRPVSQPVLQLERQSGHAPARSTVTVCEWRDGRLTIEYRGRAMNWHEWIGDVSPRRRRRPSPPSAPRRRADAHSARTILGERPEGDEGNPTLSRSGERWIDNEGTFLSS